MCPFTKPVAWRQADRTALPARLLGHPGFRFGAGETALLELDATLQFTQPLHDKFPADWRVRVIQFKVSQDRLAINPFARRHTAGTKQNAVHLPGISIPHVFCTDPGLNPATYAAWRRRHRKEIPRLIRSKGAASLCSKSNGISVYLRNLRAALVFQLETVDTAGVAGPSFARVQTPAQ